MTRVETLLNGWEEPFEGRVARDLAAALPSDSILFAGSSMPVRDLDHFMAPRMGVQVIANRGVSGIDGSVSTAIGASYAGLPTFALIGDLALLHDASGLLTSVRSGRSVTFVVVDNNGGGIFSLLPQKQALAHDEFELLFGTPHNVDIEALARAAGARVTRVARASELIPAVRAANDAGGVHLIRVPIDRARAVDRREDVAHTVAAAANDAA